MLTALASVTLKQWKLHRLRLVFTVLGIALGVAVFYGVRLGNDTMLASLRTTVEKLAGKATLQVTAGETGFPEEVLDVVRETPGVKLAEPVIEVIAHTAFGTRQQLMILGTDTTGDQSLHEYQFDEKQTELNDPLVYLAEPLSMLVSRKFAAAHNLKENDKLPVFTAQGRKDFTVRGIFEPVGAGAVFDGRIAVMDVYSAQFVFGRGRNFDRIDILTEPEASVDAVAAALRQRMPKGVEVERPAARGATMENIVSAMKQGMNITSFVALLVGLYIIFNSFLIAVNQRSKEIGVLRSLGVERGNIARMFLGEALAVGLIGSVVGVGGGYLLAFGATKLLTNVAGMTFGVVSTPEPPRFNLEFALVTCALGTLASLVAAWVPARDASRINPVLALHNIEIRGAVGTTGRRRLVIGVALALGGVLSIRFAPNRVGNFGQFAYTAVMNLGLILMLPWMTATVGRLLRPVMDRLFGTEGALAVDAMTHAPRRTTATVGALMIGLMFVYSTGAYVQSYKQVVSSWMDRTINSDLFVKSSNDVRSRTYHFSEDLSRRVAALPGVKRIENVRFVTVPFRGDSPALISLEMDGLFDRTKNLLDQGDERTVRDLVPRGEGVIVANNLATRYGLKLGDPLTLETPTGPLTRPVLGMIEDYSSEKGAIFMDRSLFIQYWKDTSIDIFDVNLMPGVDVARFKTELEALLANEQQAFIYTNVEYKQWVYQLLDGFFAIMYLQTLISVLVAALGIFNTMTISVAERRRELGVIRAIGGLRGQVRRMVLLEAATIAVTGVLTGAVAGGFNTYFLVRSAAMILGGFTIPYKFPVELILGTLPVVIGIALVAAFWPARHAVNLKVVEAIGYE